MFCIEVPDATICEAERDAIREHVILLLRETLFYSNLVEPEYVTSVLKVKFFSVRRHRSEVWTHLLMDHPMIEQGPLISIILTFFFTEENILPSGAEVSRAGLTKATYRFQHGIWVLELKPEKKIGTELF